MFALKQFLAGTPYPSAALLRSIQDQNKHSLIEKDVSDQSLMLQRQQQVVAIQQQILKAQIQSQLLGKYAGHNGLVGLNNGYTNNVGVFVIKIKKTLRNIECLWAKLTYIKLLILFLLLFSMPTEEFLLSSTNEHSRFRIRSLSCSNFISNSKYSAPWLATQMKWLMVFRQKKKTLLQWQWMNQDIALQKVFINLKNFKNFLLKLFFWITQKLNISR